MLNYVGILIILPSTGYLYTNAPAIKKRDTTVLVSATKQLFILISKVGTTLVVTIQLWLRPHISRQEVELASWHTYTGSENHFTPTDIKKKSCEDSRNWNSWYLCSFTICADTDKIENVSFSTVYIVSRKLYCLKLNSD